MTMPHSPSRAVFHGNGSATEFPFAFKVWNASQLAVSVSGPDGKSSPATGWTATLHDTGGSVTYVHEGAPLPTGWKLAIVRNMPFTQGVDLISGTQFDPQVIEDQLDQATAERQQLLEELGRAVKVDTTADETPEQLVQRIYAARNEAVTSAAAAAQSADAAEASAQNALASAGEARVDAGRACACADRAEDARDVAVEQNALVNMLMAVEMAKINAALAANKDDQQAAMDLAARWAMHPHKVPVRLNPDTQAPEFSALHWAEEARRAGLEEATELKFGIARLASALSLEQGHPTDVVTAAQMKSRTSPATEELPGIGRCATAAEVLAGKTGDNGPAFVGPEALQEVLTAASARFDLATGKVYFPGYPGQLWGFLLDVPPEDWLEADGDWLDNADVDFKELWDTLRHPAMASRVVTAAVWTQKSTAAGGVGGVPFFVVDETAKRIRLPDTRGDYTRNSGSSYLQAVGGWHGDAGRELSGKFSLAYAMWNSGSGVFATENGGSQVGGGTDFWGGAGGMDMKASRVMPTAPEFRTRTYATLGCVCVRRTQTQPKVA